MDDGIAHGDLCWNLYQISHLDTNDTGYSEQSRSRTEAVNQTQGLQVQDAKATRSPYGETVAESDGGSNLFRDFADLEADFESDCSANGIRDLYSNKRTDSVSDKGSLRTPNAEADFATIYYCNVASYRSSDLGAIFRSDAAASCSTDVRSVDHAHNRATHHRADKCTFAESTVRCILVNRMLPERSSVPIPYSEQ